MLFSVGLLSAVGFVAVPASANSIYQELLSNCSEEIYKQGYSNVTLKLARKVKKASDHRFWIDIIDNDTNAKTTAYCVGKTRTGVVETFEIKSDK